MKPPATEVGAPAGFVRLTPRDDAAGRVGCLFVLAGGLLFVGVGLLVVFAFHPEGEGDMWVMPVVGGAFALAGVVMLFAGVRGARGASTPPTEVFIEGGNRPRPGDTVHLLLRQPGAVDIESLVLTLRCERVYRRRVKPASSATVEDCDAIWEQELIDVRDERVPAGGVLVRDAVVTLPPDARPTGPASPDGRIRWQLEARGEVGLLRATYGAFEIEVGGAQADNPAVATSATSRPGPRGATARRVSPPAGCLFFGLGFLLSGVFFLWMFFSGAAFSGRGNPYMALFGGGLFTLVGLAALLVVVLSVLPTRDRGHRGGPRRRP
jgi:hypothetical protein